MRDIKVKEKRLGNIKTLDKTIAWTERVKDPIVYLNKKLNSSVENEENAIDYGNDKINFVADRIKDESIYAVKKTSNNSVEYVKKKYQQKKLNKGKKKINENKFKVKKKKSLNKPLKNDKSFKEKVSGQKRMLEEGKKKVSKGAKHTYQITKKISEVIVSTIKGIICGAKSLFGLLIAGGTMSVVVIIIICFVGLLTTSIFGIFFSNEKIASGDMTMNDAILECNKEFNNKLEIIQNQNAHDEYVLEGNMASWKDVLLIYAIKQSNGKNEQEVINMNDNKKKELKKIFWDMNEINYEVKMEAVNPSSSKTEDIVGVTRKNVLHIYIKSKNADDMKRLYNFNSLQLKQYQELSSDKYNNLWSRTISDSNDSKFSNWKQYNPAWANVRIGKSKGTIGSIGCLVTSVAILIEKSGVNTNINYFNPGTFVEALNKNGGFDSSGNLQYMAISRVVPKFQYVGKVNLRGKSKSDKLALIKQYLSLGYYLTAEVKGATIGNQHWVALVEVEGDNAIMADPGSEQTSLWNAYNYTKTTQFNYFRIEM